MCDPTPTKLGNANSSVALVIPIDVQYLSRRILGELLFDYTSRLPAAPQTNRVLWCRSVLA